MIVLITLSIAVANHSNFVIASSTDTNAKPLKSKDLPTNNPPEKSVLPSARQPDKLRGVDNLPKCWPGRLS
jgi:hypothetical protein